MMIVILSFIVSFLGSTVLKRWGIVDVPTERSSHTKPTSRMGGMAILLGLGVFCFYTFSYPSYYYLMGCLGFGLLGFYDDYRPLSPFIRLGVQLVLAFHLAFHLAPHDHGPAFCLAVWIVGFVNVFNFMDGLNGMSGLTALIYAVFFILWIPELEPFMVSLAASLVGFLIYNMQGKLFLGDGGSYFLGSLLATCPFLSMTPDHAYWSHMAFFVPLLFGLYLFDTGLTFIKRLYKGENVFTPHKQHLYQRLHQKGWSHLQVSSLYGFFQTVLVGTMLFYYNPWFLYPLWFSVFSCIALYEKKLCPL